MAITKERKEEIINNLREKVSNQKSIVFVNFSGLKANNLIELRRKLKNTGGEFSVFKKTLMKVVLKEKNININFEDLKGEVALIFGFNDEISSVKTAYDFSKKNKELKILGGVLENEFKPENDIIVLAQLPSRYELLAKFVGTINAPVSNFVGALNNNIKNFVYVLGEINKIKSN